MHCFVVFLVKELVFCLQTQHERSENSQLRAENEKLRADNMRYREALSNASCPNCGGPTAIGEMSFDEHHLRLENARLREEVLSFATFLMCEICHFLYLFLF